MEYTDYHFIAQVADRIDPLDGFKGVYFNSEKEIEWIELDSLLRFERYWPIKYWLKLFKKYKKNFPIQNFACKKKEKHVFIMENPIVL